MEIQEFPPMNTEKIGFKSNSSMEAYMNIGHQELARHT